MAYRVNSDRVAADVAKFSDAALRYWTVCLAEIAADPSPRSGYYVERVLPVRPMLMRTFLFWITEEVSVSGEHFFAFTSEFLAEYVPLYVVNEGEKEVAIFYLRLSP